MPKKENNYPKTFFAINEHFHFVKIFSTGQSIIDSRCYLHGGGSAESLTANEDVSVGSVIGKSHACMFRERKTEAVNSFMVL